VRCGELLLERLAPAEVAGYRRSFVPATAATANASARDAFHRAYPVDADLEASLRSAIESVPPS